MNIALVDDRETDRLHLEQALKRYDSIHQIGMVFSHFSSGEALLKEYQLYKYAIIFLDIYMDGIGGIEAARKIRETDDETALVFMTSSEEHRSDAFSVFASAYLSKPCPDEEIYRTVDHLLHIRTVNDRHFFFSFDRKDYSLRFDELVSLETNGNYLSIVDRSGKTYRTRMTFSTAESQLDQRFLTLMKGITVNMDYISQIIDSRCLMQSGAVFPIHIKNQKELREKWLNYKFSKIRDGLAGTGDHHV